MKEFLTINNEKLLKLRSTKYYENYFSIKLTTSDNFEGTILVGPTISCGIDEKSIDLLIKEFNLLAKDRRKLIDYYNHLIIMDFNSFSDIALLLYNLIYDYKLDSYDLLTNDQALINVESKKNNTIDTYLSTNKREFVLHHSQKYERELLTWIKEGNIKKLKDLTESESNIDGNKGVHSKNPLRNEKNIFISFTSLVSHAAIEGGLDWELALSLSDFYIQTVEECNVIVDIYNLYEKMFLDYGERVHKIKTSNYSISVLKCLNYISQNLYTKISLSQIANHTSVNPSYISYLFKKEVGISITEYIQREKVEEAKTLIESGEKSFADIYVSLGFIDQSHFTKTFKKFVGISPKDYRLLYSSIN
ncbi:helix-turn-helix domain-containing protein [Clostridium sp. C8]|uniref:HTH-type transcriptional activator RhaR n=1 Tax=bioreactor metagenome TaxID=1076179 RepID=A0A644WQD3_9ZZZZ|nr:helix-turn-helix domain-containing protein [Clostridium sp. C8]